MLEAGIHVLVMPVPSAIRAGCGLCLRLPPSETGEAEKSLQKSGIIPQCIYTRIENDGQSEFIIMKAENYGT